MNNAKDFLTDQQLSIMLNTQGALWTNDGNPAPDETLGGELERFFQKYNEPLLAVSAVFDEYDRYVSDDDADNKTELGITISHFAAWTENHLIVVLDSIFNDKYLAVLDTKPIPDAKVVQNQKDYLESSD